MHVLRITRLLGWHKAENPEDARYALNTFFAPVLMILHRISLESWLPTELQPEINPLLVGFGQVRLSCFASCDITDLACRRYAQLTARAAVNASSARQGCVPVLKCRRRRNPRPSRIGDGLIECPSKVDVCALSGGLYKDAGLGWSSTMDGKHSHCNVAVDMQIRDIARYQRSTTLDYDF